MINLYRLIDELCSILYELSLEISLIQKKGTFKLDYKDYEKKDPITSADLYSNSFLKKNLMKLLPQSCILSEETTDNLNRLSHEFVWIIDPIDGTKDFINKKTSYAISVGLVYKNKPILGVVSMPGENFLVLGLNYKDKDYNPFLLIYRFSINQKEVYYNFEYEKKTLENAKILVSESEYKKNKFSQFPQNWHIEPTGSVARKLAMVAINDGDLLISLVPKNEWDICGGIALIYASQKIAYTLEKDEKGSFLSHSFNKKILTSMGLVAGNPDLVHEYLEFHKKNQIKTYSEY